MNKTMTQEVKEAIEKAQEFAEATAPEAVDGKAEPMNKPEEPETKAKGKQAPKKQDAKKAGKTEVMTREEIKAGLIMTKEFKKRSGVIEKNLASIENSFLIIAFNLHWIKRNAMHKTAGFKNIYEYAEETHGIGKTTCSNLICIVENFAERDENGEVVERIAECYRKFKQSQLVALMGLPAEKVAQIDEKTSVREINRIKHEMEIVQNEDSGEEPEEGEDDTGSGKDKPGTVKKIINTLISFSDYKKYQEELEEVDVLIERAFKKSKTPVTIKIVCEKG